MKESINLNNMETTQVVKQPIVTHWKKLTNPNYIGAHDLQPGQEVKITFKTISKEMIDGADGKKEECIVAKLEGAKKPMILNKTNCKIITKVLDTPYVEEWSGKSVIIYAAKVRAFGEMVEALRVKNQKV
jgi:hypothetical protein